MPPAFLSELVFPGQVPSTASVGSSARLHCAGALRR